MWWAPGHSRSTPKKISGIDMVEEFIEDGGGGVTIAILASAMP
jgi:hypothetical protein